MPFADVWAFQVPEGMSEAQALACQAYSMFRNKQDPCIKVVLQPQGRGRHSDRAGARRSIMMATNALILPVETETLDFTHGSVLFIGTATTLIRYAGFTILTDPNFLHAGDHAHLGYGLTSARQTNPAIEIEGLPRLDLCVLSHLHGDHWDHVATEKLPKALPVITTPHAAADLRRQGFTMPQGLETAVHLWRYLGLR
jgi:glyoxylase-like metal-dependent hydrolase (beta-lactamase superfamily II)